MTLEYTRILEDTLTYLEVISDDTREVTMCIERVLARERANIKTQAATLSKEDIAALTALLNIEVPGEIT